MWCFEKMEIDCWNLDLELELELGLRNGVEEWVEKWNLFFFFG